MFAQGDVATVKVYSEAAADHATEQAEKTSTPIWITNTGLKSTGLKGVTVELSFRELCDNITALFEAARQMFVEIPKEAHERQRKKQAAANATSEQNVEQGHRGANTERLPPQ